MGEAANHEAEYHLVLHGGGGFNVDLNDSVLAHGLKLQSSCWDATVSARMPVFVSPPTTQSLILVPLGSSLEFHCVHYRTQNTTQQNGEQGETGQVYRSGTQLLAA